MHHANLNFYAALLYVLETKLFYAVVVLAIRTDLFLTKNYTVNLKPIAAT